MYICPLCFSKNWRGKYLFSIPCSSRSQSSMKLSITSITMNAPVMEPSYFTDVGLIKLVHLYDRVENILDICTTQESDAYISGLIESQNIWKMGYWLKSHLIFSSVVVNWLFWCRSLKAMNNRVFLVWIRIIFACYEILRSSPIQRALPYSNCVRRPLPIDLIIFKSSGAELI